MKTERGARRREGTREEGDLTVPHDLLTASNLCALRNTAKPHSPWGAVTVRIAAQALGVRASTAKSFLRQAEAANLVRPARERFMGEPSWEWTRDGTWSVAQACKPGADW